MGGRCSRVSADGIPWNLTRFLKFNPWPPLPPLASSSHVALTAAALAALVAGAELPAHADISGLTPCAESKAFAKRKKNELKELEKRLKKVGILSDGTNDV